jgi:hypothetical protein
LIVCCSGSTDELVSIFRSISAIKLRRRAAQPEDKLAFTFDPDMAPSLAEIAEQAKEVITRPATPVKAPNLRPRNGKSRDTLLCVRLGGLSARPSIISLFAMKLCRLRFSRI